jgi:hypothetical protein
LVRNDFRFTERPESNPQWIRRTNFVVNVRTNFVGDELGPITPLILDRGRDWSIGQTPIVLTDNADPEGPAPLQPSIADSGPGFGLSLVILLAVCSFAAYLRSQGSVHAPGVELINEEKLVGEQEHLGEPLPDIHVG